MKIEIISGEKDLPPMGPNTIIKINGKDITKDMFIDHIWFEVWAGETARYGFSFKDGAVLLNFGVKIKKLKLKCKNMWHKIKKAYS